MLGRRRHLRNRAAGMPRMGGSLRARREHQHGDDRVGAALYYLHPRAARTSLFFFLNDPPPTEIYPLPPHAALPISPGSSWLRAGLVPAGVVVAALAVASGPGRRPGASRGRRAAVLGAATGISWGFMAAVIKELSEIGRAHV